MARMRTGRKNGGPGDPPREEVTSLPAKRATYVRPEGMLQQQYGAGAYKYTMPGEDSGTVAVSEYGGKKNLRMPTSKVEAIKARNQAKRDEAMAKNKAYFDAKYKDEKLQEGYETRKSQHAQALKDYESAVAQGAAPGDIMNVGGGEQGRSMQQAQFGGGRYLTASESKAYRDIRKDSPEIKGTRYYASNPEYIGYDTMREGPEKEALGKKLLADALKKDPDVQLKRDKGSVERSIAHVAMKPGEFTEKRPARLSIPEPSETPTYEEEPKVESTYTARAPKLKPLATESTAEWKDPSKPGKGAKVAKTQKIEGVKPTPKKDRYMERGSYGKEGKMAKSYFGEFAGQSLSDVQEEKQAIKETQAYKSGDKGAKEMLKSARLAEKYMKRMPRSAQARGVEEGQDIEYSKYDRKGNQKGISTYTPSRMEGYKAAMQAKMNRENFYGDAFNSDDMQRISAIPTRKNK